MEHNTKEELPNQPTTSRQRDIPQRIDPDTGEGLHGHYNEQGTKLYTIYNHLHDFVSIKFSTL